MRTEPSHEDHLHRAIDPIRRHGAGGPAVLATLARTLRQVRSESIRRDLPGPIEPIDEMIEAIAATMDTTTWSRHEIAELGRLVSGEGPGDQAGDVARSLGE